MEQYQKFRELMNTLENFINSAEHKDFDGIVHIVIDDNNIEEFEEIISELMIVSSSDDNYVDEIIEYLNEINLKITDKNMIDKFIPLFAAINCLANMDILPMPTKNIVVDDWVFELHDLNESVPPMDARIGKVINIIENEDGTFTHKIKSPLTNDIIEWEDATFVIIPNMEKTIKSYKEKYTKIF